MCRVCPRIVDETPRRKLFRTFLKMFYVLRTFKTLWSQSLKRSEDTVAVALHEAEAPVRLEPLQDLRQLRRLEVRLREGGQRPATTCVTMRTLDVEMIQSENI